MCGPSIKKLNEGPGDSPLRDVTKARMLADYLHALADLHESGRDVKFPLSGENLESAMQDAYDEYLRFVFPLLPFPQNTQVLPPAGNKESETNE